MEAETNGPQKEQFRLSAEQQEEIGDILLSARAVSRQMIAQAQQQADEILQAANERAETLVHEAEEKAEETARAADEKAAETIRAAEERAAEIRREAEERAAEIAPAAAGTADEEDEETDGEEPAASAMSEEMQEYVVRCVGDCFARLRQQQLDTVDYINEQWRGFLSGLALPELPTPGTARGREESSGEDVSRQEIEERVSAIAKELMEIIGK